MASSEHDNILEQQHFLDSVALCERIQKNIIICMIYPRSDTTWHANLCGKWDSIFPVRIQDHPNGERQIFTNLSGNQRKLLHAEDYTIIDFDKANKTVFPKFTQFFGMAVRFHTSRD